MKFSVAAIIASIVAVQAAPALEPRSNYPPDYPIQFSCKVKTPSHPHILTSKKTDGPVQVCATNKDYGNFPRLVVTYKREGYLWAQGSPLSAWVKLNDNADTFGPFKADQEYLGVDKIPSASYGIGSPRDVQMCYHPTVSDNSTYPEEGQYRRCPNVNDAYPLLPGGPAEGSIGWFANPPIQKDLNLINPAKGKSWNVQVAVVNAKGNWDSKYGQNYRFTV
ncbi:hypothetical protein HDU97_001905 [Phlyctochytrium planicorne]|nr:hypothetical protein HDU97_001905 [Phlyctochytrium planicorne]